MKKWLVVIIAVVVIIALYEVFINNKVETETPAETNLVELQEWNVPTLEPAKVNEDGFAPEATEEYSYGEMKFKLPNTYKPYVNGNGTSSDIYMTDITKNEQFTVVVIPPTEITGGELTDEQAQENLKNFDIKESFVEEGVELEKITELGLTTESYNGLIFHIAKLTVDDEEVGKLYAEYDYIIHGNKLYGMAFMVQFYEGENIDQTRSNQFFNIKNSINFD